MSVKRRDKKGRILLTNEKQLADGRYEYRYKGSDGKRHSLYSWKLVPTDPVPQGKRSTTSLREMKQNLEADKVKRIDSYKARATSVGDCYQIFLSHKNTVTRKTLDIYKGLYQSFIQHRIGSIRINNVTPENIKQLYLDMLDEDELTMATVEKVNTTLTEMFNEATKDKLIDYNPCDGVLKEIRRYRRYKPQHKRGLTIDEQTRFMRYISDTERFRKWEPLFTFLLGTGCRVCEALALTWDDCSFENEAISINKTLQYYRRDDTELYGYSISLPKTNNGVRDIPMLPEIKELLLKMRKDEDERPHQRVYIDGVTGFIWRNQGDRVPIPGTVNAALYAIQKSYNQHETELARQENRSPVLLPKFSVHVLRHTFCTRLCENETDLKLIQEVMGHGDISTTMNVYNNITMQYKTDKFKDLAGKIVL